MLGSPPPPAKAPLPGRVVPQPRRKLGRAKVGPEAGRKVELAVGRLEEQKVGEALLAAGADDEVGLLGRGAGERVFVRA